MLIGNSPSIPAWPVTCPHTISCWSGWNTTTWRSSLSNSISLLLCLLDFFLGQYHRVFLLYSTCMLIGILPFRSFLVQGFHFLRFYVHTLMMFWFRPISLTRWCPWSSVCDSWRYESLKTFASLSGTFWRCAWWVTLTGIGDFYWIDVCNWLVGGFKLIVQWWWWIIYGVVMWATVCLCQHARRCMSVSVCVYV